MKYVEWVKKVSLCASLLFVFLLFGTAQATSQTRFLISGDWAQFKNSKGQSYFEIYYSIPKAAVVYRRENGKGFIAQILMSMRIVKNDSLWAANAWKIQDQVQDTSSISPLEQFIDLFRYATEGEGKYTIHLFARDLNQEGAEDSIVINASIRSFSPDSIQMSDIQLASKIEAHRGDRPALFQKGRYDIIPNPGQLYGEGASELFYYVEFYNLLKAISGEEFKISFSVLDNNHNQLNMIKIPTKIRKKQFNSIMELGKFDLSSLPTGIYSLYCTVRDSRDTTLISGEKKFFVYNPGVEPLAGVQTESAPIVSQFKFLDGMSEKQLDSEFDKMRYLTKPEHRAFYKSLKNSDAKKDYIYTLWKELRTDKTMRTDVYRQLYLQRVKQANQMFSHGLQDGWKTDEGRVFILYGPPSNVERHENEIDMKPYRIWQYEHIEGGVIFVFVDRQGFNRFELIHSTKRGELYEPNWETLIRVAR